MTRPELVEVIPVGEGAGSPVGHWWVTSIERWRDHTAVNYVVWSEEPNFPLARAQSPEAGLLYWGVWLADDVGTVYLLRGGGAGTSLHVIAGRQAFEGVIPPEARSLTVTLFQASHAPDATAEVLGTIQLPIRPQASPDEDPASES